VFTSLGLILCLVVIIYSGITLAVLMDACNSSNNDANSQTIIVFDDPSQGAVSCGAGQPINKGILGVSVIQFVVAVTIHFTSMLFIVSISLSSSFFLSFCLSLSLSLSLSVRACVCVCVCVCVHQWCRKINMLLCMYRWLYQCLDVRAAVVNALLVWKRRM
jgi:hypothetical protein